jgi:hypothetical protein
MSWLRFSIPWLTLVIVFAAVAGAAYCRESGNPFGSDVNTRVWSNTFYTLTVASLAISTLTALGIGGRARMRFLGFALFAWAYLQLAWDTEFDRNRSQFIHTQFLYHALDRLTSFEAPGAPNAKWSAVQRMHTIIQSLLTLGAGLAGSALGPWVARETEFPGESPRPEVNSA